MQTLLIGYEIVDSRDRLRFEKKLHMIKEELFLFNVTFSCIFIELSVDP